MNQRFESLHLLEAACWQELERASHDLDHDWRAMALATVDGDAGDARMVVLREIHRHHRELLFYTDARSPKVAQMQARPSATLLAWSPKLRWQLRLRVALQVETGGLAVSSRWARLKMTPAAYDYLSPLPPGTPVERFIVERGSREHFALVTATVHAIDWLELHPDGHRRAQFDAAGAQWLQP